MKSMTEYILIIGNKTTFVIWLFFAVGLVYQIRLHLSGIMYGSFSKHTKTCRKKANAAAKEQTIWRRITMTYIGDYVSDKLRKPYKMYMVFKVVFDISMITHLATGEPYSAKDAITDALAGAASGALAATALGAVGQVIGNAAISGASKALELRNEPMSINKAISIGKSVLSGAICGAIGGKGLTNSTRVMKQISIINSNAHCAFRPSAFNSIKNSATRISKDIFDCLAGYTKGSFVSNALSQFSKVME